MSDLKDLFEYAPEGAVELRGANEGIARWFNLEGNLYNNGRWLVPTYHDIWKTIATRPQPETTHNPPETFGYDFKAESERRKEMFEGAIEETANSIHNPQPEQPRKTVEDAVEYFSGVWPDDEYSCLFTTSTDWNGVPETKGSYIAANSDGVMKDGAKIILGCNAWSLVCTRKQFDACVATKAKSEPEWTHIYMEEKAYIKVSEPDCDGYILVVTEGAGYNLARLDELKPIKPTITKAEAEERLGVTITD